MDLCPERRRQRPGGRRDGSDSFTYTASDGHGGTATTTLSLTVTGANDGPVAAADAATTAENTTASGNVLANDSDPDASDVLTVSAVDGQAANVGAAVAGTWGTLTLDADGSWTYVPNAAANGLAVGETGSDSFTYTASDGHGGTATTTLSLTVTGANDGPVAAADTATTAENTTASGNVLANDSDPDASDVLTVSAVDGQAANVGAAVAGTWGTLTLDADGSWTYVPNAAANGLAVGETAATASPIPQATATAAPPPPRSASPSPAPTTARSPPPMPPRRPRTPPPPATCSPTTAIPTPPMS